MYKSYQNDRIDWPSEAPLISVVITTLGSDFSVLQSISSVLNSTVQELEILLIKTADQTLNLDNLYTQQTIPLRELRYRGLVDLAKMANFGLAHSRGKYVCCLEPTFQVFPTYFEKALYILENEKVDVFSPSVLLNQETSTSSLIKWYPSVSPQTEELTRGNRLAPVSVFLRTKSARFSSLPKDTPKSVRKIDFAKFWIDASLQGAKIRGVTDVLARRSPSLLDLVDGTNVKYTWNFTREVSVDRKRLFERYIRRRRKDSQCITVHQPPSKSVHTKTCVNIQSTSKRNVLLVLPYLVLGGAVRRLLEIADWLKQEGYRVYVLTTEEQGAGALDVSDRFEEISDGIYPLPSFMGTQEHARSDWQKFVHYLIYSKDINLIVQAGSRFFYDMLPSLRQLHSQVRIVDQQFNTEGHFTSNQCYASFIDHTVVENEDIERELIDTCHRDPASFTLIHNGIDLEGKFNPQKYLDKDRPKRLMGKIVISFIGRISEEKGPDIFIEIARRFRSHYEIHFVLAGPGPLQEYLKEQIQFYGIEQTVTVYGNVDSAEYLSYTDILLVPSRVEGRPNVVLEALSMKVPVIASKVGGIPHFLKDQENALLCESEDVAGFCLAIHRLVSDSSLMNSLKENSRRYALNHLSLDKCKQAYFTLFDRLLSTPDL
jgi:glycosyltransferase involved in cell wall biosynthesis